MIEPPNNAVLEEALQSLRRARAATGLPGNLRSDAELHFYAALASAWLLLAQRDPPQHDEVGVTTQRTTVACLMTTSPDGAAWLPAFTNLDRLRMRFPEARGYQAFPARAVAEMALRSAATRGVLLDPGPGNAGAHVLDRTALEAVQRGSAPAEAAPQLTAHATRRAPAAWDLQRIDAATRSINLPVVVFGTNAFTRVEHVLTRVGGAQHAVDVPRAPDEPSLRYALLGLGSIRDYRIWAHLYGFEPDDRIRETIARHVTHAAGLVLDFAAGTENQAQSRSVLGAIASALPPEIPFTVLGDAALATTATGLYRRNPSYVGADIFEALKTLMKSALNRLKAM